MSGKSVFRKEARGRLFASSAIRGHREVSRLHPTRGSLPGLVPWSWTSQPPKLSRDKFLSFKNLLGQCILLEQSKRNKTHSEVINVTLKDVGRMYSGYDVWVWHFASVIILPQIYNLCLMMRKWSEKNSNWGTFYMIITLQNCEKSSKLRKV